MVSSAYLRLLTFLPAILISAYASSSLAFHIMYSGYKLNKQGDNIQPWPILNQSVVPCVCVCVCVCVLVAQSCRQHVLQYHGLWPVRFLCPWKSPCKNTEVGSLLQGIFPTQGSNLGLPHHRQIFHWLSRQGSPPLFHIQFCCFMTCIQVSLVAGKVIWYSQLFKNFLRLLWSTQPNAFA